MTLGQEANRGLPMRSRSMYRRFRGGFALIVAAAVAIEVATMGIVAIVGSQTPLSAGESVPRLVVKARERITGLGERANLRVPVEASIAGQSCLPPQKMVERLQADQEATGGKL